MAEIAVNVAVMQDGMILLTQREDLETWVLPSGGVEDGESLAQAAIRETKEETGLDVELTGLVGVYSRLGNFFPGHMVLFAARPIGGKIQCQEGETISVEWFPLEKLPTLLAPGHKRRITDAMAGISGVAVLQKIAIPVLPEKLTRKRLMGLRDNSGLARQEFSRLLIEQAEIREINEVSGIHGETQ